MHPMPSNGFYKAPPRRYTLIGLVAIVALFALVWLLWPSGKPTGTLSSATVDVPIVMHTSGGRLEVATVTAIEAFQLEAPPQSVLGIDLGRTVSHVQVKVVYRYHIDMAKEWPVRFQRNAAVVEAGAIQPTLPVAFDTSTMQTQTWSGWARFDKHENLAQLERRMSSELERRSRGYMHLALPAARQTIGAFVQNWLSRQRPWQSREIKEVKVVLPGDPPVSGITLRPTPAEE